MSHVTLSASAAIIANALVGKVAAWQSILSAVDCERDTTGPDGIVTRAPLSASHVDAVYAAVAAAVDALPVPTGSRKAARKTLANYTSALRTAAARGVAYRDSTGRGLAYPALLSANTEADPAEKAAAERAAAEEKAAEEAAEKESAERAAVLAEAAKVAEAAAQALQDELAALRAKVAELTAANATLTAERDAARSDYQRLHDAMHAEAARAAAAVDTGANVNNAATAAAAAVLTVAKGSRKGSRKAVAMA